MTKPRIIALTGLAGSGKSTVAEIVGGPQVAFAEPLKRFCGEVFGFTNEELYGASSARERPSTRFTRPNGEPLTARFALQTLGTEWGRNCDPDVWAKAGIERAKRKLVDANSDPYRERDENVVIPDLRFVNEAQLVRAAGGEVWRVYRPGQGANATHASERDVWSSAMAGYVTAEIPNVGTLADLQRMVRLALSDLGI